MGSQYERELRAVLAGIPKGVEAVTRSCDPVAKAKAMQVVERPFLVVRAAGSGMEGSGDLLALRGDMCFPIEVKTSKKSKFECLKVSNFRNIRISKLQFPKFQSFKITKIRSQNIKSKNNANVNKSMCAHLPFQDF